MKNKDWTITRWPPFFIDIKKDRRHEERREREETGAPDVLHLRAPARERDKK